jgi:hypothetical protein
MILPLPVSKKVDKMNARHPVLNISLLRLNTAIGVLQLLVAHSVLFHV